ncbi:unnamed protein product [Lota lota]
MANGLLFSWVVLLVSWDLARGSGGVLEVVRGRWAFLSPSALNIRVEEAEECKVEVVTNEPITQRVGKLSPQVFDCMFQEEEVKYVHNGSPLLDQDSVKLRVYRFSASDTVLQTVVLTVRILEGGSSLVQLGSAPLVVLGFYGLSNPINSSVLSITPRGGVACSVRLMTSESELPSAGQLVREEDSVLRKGPPGREMVDMCPGNKPCLQAPWGLQALKLGCLEFLGAGLRYQHLRPPSPQTDYIPLRVELRDHASRALIEWEAVWVPVLVQGAVQNQPPQASFMPSFILEVDQFILTPLTTAALDASDPDDPDDPQTRLVFNVTTPPAQGYLTHLDDLTKAVSSFSWADLYDMNIAFQPPNSSHAHRRNLQVEFQAIDRSFAASPPILVHISIRTTQTNAPRVSWNMGLDLLEGQSRPITWEDLQIVDNDNINAVYLVAVDGPLHGRLTVRGERAFMFSVGDLKAGQVVYHHSDSDSTRDHVVFRISDGAHSVRHKFPIHILPKDDAPPFLINNVAVETREGGAVLLEEFMLLAADLDSSDDHILFQIVSAPRAGRLERRSSAHGPGVQVDSFFQRDLSQGLVYYVHSGQEVFEDSFDFTLSDNQQPPNQSPPQTVVVHVFPVKDQLPVEVRGSVRSLSVRETEVVYLTNAHLHFRDPEQPDADLTFLITQPCSSPAWPRLMDAGRLFLTDSTYSMKKDPMVPVLKSFTQHAVNHLKVAFMPPMEDIGPDPLLVHFTFSVSDLHGGSVSDLTFNITILPVDNQPPEVYTNLLQVEEGGGVFVTEEHLLVRDVDSQEEELRVEVEREALHGWLELQGRALQQDQNFTLGDLRGLRLRYIHDDSETTEDSSVLRVTDGHNSASIRLSIQVVPVNDEPPQLSRGLRGELRCDEGGRVQVTLDYLWATDPDSEDSRLSYMLARSPARGQLQNQGLEVDRFSQQDLLLGHIYYVHTGGEVGADPVSDTVTLIVSDGEAGAADGCCHGDAPPPPVPLHGSLPVYDLNVTVLPVNNKVPAVTMDSMLVVAEASWVCLCGGSLGASDADSPPDQLTFHLETPPLHGFLENTLPTPGHQKSNAGQSIDTFSLTHLALGYINYVQSEHKGVEPSVDQLSVSVSDGLHRSAPSPLYIIITPTNDEPPSLLLTNFTVMEGGLVELGPSVINGLDLDAPQEVLTFTLLAPPLHGLLLGAVYGWEAGRYRSLAPDVLLGLSVTSFSLQQLRQGLRLLYVHDDSEVQQDRLVLQLTDGRHSVQGAAHVSVHPVNDHAPRILTNAGLQMDSERRAVSSVVLEAEDLDSPPDQVFYILEAGPRLGKLQLRTGSAWSELSAGQNFTQEDVQMNRLWYANTAPSGVKGHDSFRFHLSDLQNESPAQSFYISLPSAHRGALVLLSKAVGLQAGQRLVLTTDTLLARDGAGRAEELLFNVTEEPRHGVLHLARAPGVPLLSFTQLDVSAHRVCYTHDNSWSAHTDSFSFLVTNGDATVSGRVELIIRHGDRLAPTLTRNAPLRLGAGSSRVIPPELLALSDPDTPPAGLRYTVTRPPQHGTLLLLGHAPSLLRLPGTRPLHFTQEDVDHQALAYQHRAGSPSHTDTFYFLPSDGTNRGFLEHGRLGEEPAEFTIEVERLDRSAPTLARLGRPSRVLDLGSGRRGIRITSRELQASDPDSPEQQLEYAITTPPAHGHLENTITGGFIQGRFTQQDLDQRGVVYLLPPDLEVTSDHFTFQLRDPAGNTLPPQRLQLSWSRVQLAVSCYRVCETSGPLAVQVVRTGNSADPAYVGIQVEEGTAKLDKDFTHSTASLIQFDPGVNVKTWTVYLHDDQLEENQESFSIILSNPDNAVLGPRHSITVEIIDPRGGSCDPEDLKVADESSTPPPPPPGAAEEGPITDIEAELLWDSHAPPARGDVPRPHDREYVEEAEPQDQPLQYPLRPAGGDRPLHMLIPHLHQGNEPQTGESEVRCGRGWMLHSGMCYWLGGGVATWSSAQRTCSLLFNSSLSSLHSGKDLAWLWRFAGRRPFWIGLTGGPGRWAWQDGRSLHFSRLRFQQGATDPGGDSGESRCVLVQDARTWIPTSCTEEPQHLYICSTSALHP